jgi:hypothetical protein
MSRPGMMLGRKPPKRNRNTLIMKDYLKATAPPPPPLQSLLRIRHLLPHDAQ